MSIYALQVLRWSSRGTSKSLKGQDDHVTPAMAPETVAMQQ